MSFMTGSSFVAPPSSSEGAIQLRGASSVATAVVAAAAPIAAQARDEYVPYRMTGEWQIELVGEYFLMTGAMTFFAFACYFGHSARPPRCWLTAQSPAVACVKVL